LRKESKFFRIADFELVDRFDGIDDDSPIGSFAGGSDNFLVILVANQNDGAVLAREFERFKVDLGDERASGVDDFEGTRFGLFADGGRNAVCAEDENRAVGNFFDGFDENGAAAAELFHDIGVVDNFMMDVDRVAVGFKGEFDDVHGTDYAGAEAARADAQKYFSVGFSRHLLPNSRVYQNSIIP